MDRCGAPLAPLRALPPKGDPSCPASPQFHPYQMKLPSSYKGDQAKPGGGGCRSRDSCRSAPPSASVASLSTTLRAVPLSRKRERNADCEIVPSSRSRDSSPRLRGRGTSRRLVEGGATRAVKRWAASMQEQ